MKLPKKNYLWLVERCVWDVDNREVHVPIAIFATEESADNYAGQCHQEFTDRGFDENEFKFNVSILSFYNV